MPYIVLYIYIYNTEQINVQMYEVINTNIGRGVLLDIF